MAEKQETYVERRGLDRKKNSLLFEMIFICFLAMTILYSYFYWNVRAGLNDFDNHHYAEAAEKWKKAVFFSPLDSGLKYKIALAYSRLQRHQEVIDWCSNLLNTEAPAIPLQFYSGLPLPSYVEIYLGMAIAYLGLDQYAEAIAYAQQMLTVNREDPLAYRLLAIAHHKRAKIRRENASLWAAVKFYEKAQSLDPGVLTEEDLLSLRMLKQEIGVE